MIFSETDNQRSIRLNYENKELVDDIFAAFREACDQGKVAVAQKLMKILTETRQKYPEQYKSQHRCHQLVDAHFELLELELLHVDDLTLQIDNVA